MFDLRTIKLGSLKIARGAGLFAASQRLTASGLRILCYHGISTGDEHRFRPKLFMKSETFERRMEWLKRQGYRVIRLGEAVRRMQVGESLEHCVVAGLP
jgi:hypothetical protein